MPESPVWDYLNTFGDDRRATVSTFQKRSVWSQTTDGKIPDAFLPVMHHTGPRLVLNPDGYNCTNTIHRVFFETALSTPQRQLLAISLLTTFSQISAELCGRRYGSGVLKHEPRDAEQILLFLPEVSDMAISATYNRIDALLRTGDAAGARALADKAIFDWSGITCSALEMTSLSEALTEMRLRRRPNRSRLDPTVVPHLPQSSGVARVEAF
ncbi:hypothetical protein D3C72_986000 [compost metagenome]